MIAAAPPLRILMTADPIGGVWTFSLDLIHALSGSNVRFALATMGRSLEPAQREQVARLNNARLYESAFKVEWMDEPWDDVSKAADWLSDIADEFMPDLIHLNGYAHAALPWDRPVLVAAHSCVYSWFSAVRGLPPPRHLWSLYHQHVRLGLNAATLITAPTRAMLESLHIHYGNTFKASKVIHNGRPPHLFRPQPKDDIILTGGRLWDEAKNIKALDAAAAEIAWPVLAAGDDRHPNGGRSGFGNLKCLGPLSPPRFAEELSRASIFALPALYEPFGLSALEAALSGCTLVLGDIPTLREVWGDAAYFVPPNNPRAWIEALQNLLAKPSLRSDLAGRAAKRARAFTAKRMAGGYLEAYRSIQSGGRDSSLTGSARVPVPGLN